jgi:peptidoglycan/LPS O-acetylase OafA/YrhL
MEQANIKIGKKTASQPLQDKIKYLEGLRGLSMLIIVVHHFACGFYPALVFGNYAQPHHLWEMSIYKTPLNLFFSGHFAACIFFVMSGYVLSYKFFRYSDAASVVSSAVRRYFRLMVPTLASLIIAYFFLKAALFYNQSIVASTWSTMWLAKCWNFKPDFLEMLSQGLVDIYIKPDSFSYNYNLWMIFYIFSGSFFVYSFLLLFGSLKKRGFIYAAFVLLFYDTYFLSFVLGILYCDLSVNYSDKIAAKSWQKKMIYAVFFLIALFLGSYPIAEVRGTIYEAITPPNMQYIFFHITGAFLLFFTLGSFSPIKTFLSSRTMLFLGKISFSMYLIHLIIICSFSSLLFKSLLPYVSYDAGFVIMLVPSLALIIFTSYYFHRHIDCFGMKLSRMVLNYLKGENR